MFFLTLFVILISLVAFMIHRRFKTFERDGFIYDQPKFPFGNLNNIKIGNHPAQIIQKLYLKFKGKSPVAGIFFFLQPNVLILDLDVVKDILIRNFDNFRNRGLYFNERDDPLSAHIFAVEDQTWRNMRQKITPTFTSGKMKMMFGTVLDVSNHLIENLRKSGKVKLIFSNAKIFFIHLKTFLAL
jgi:cytochrome P450 family 6